MFAHSAPFTLGTGSLRVCQVNGVTGHGDGAAVFETCLRLQWRYFGIIFEFDHHDGELWGVSEFLRDMFPAATLVPAHVRAFLRPLDTVHPAIDAAIREGVVYEDRHQLQSPVRGEVIEKLGELSPEQLRMLLAALREDVPA